MSDSSCKAQAAEEVRDSNGTIHALEFCLIFGGIHLSCGLRPAVWELKYLPRLIVAIKLLFSLFLREVDTW